MDAASSEFPSFAEAIDSTTLTGVQTRSQILHSMFGSNSTSCTDVLFDEIPDAPESEAYFMDHPRTGHALIFNHREYKDMFKNRKREGSDHDAIRLYNVLNKIGFEVKVHSDLTLHQIKVEVNKLAAMSHWDCDCVLVAVLTHGLSDGSLMASDLPYPTETIWVPFVPRNCPSLNQKPKIFLFQACRGDLRDREFPDNSPAEETKEEFKYNISSKNAIMADFFFAYSSVDGFVSWSNPIFGSRFIQTFCSVMEEYAFEEELEKLFQKITRTVIEKYGNENKQKQVPQRVSSLRYELIFKKKSPRKKMLSSQASTSTTKDNDMASEHIQRVDSEASNKAPELKSGDQEYTEPQVAVNDAPLPAEVTPFVPEPQAVNDAPVSAAVTPFVPEPQAVNDAPPPAAPPDPAPPPQKPKMPVEKKIIREVRRMFRKL